MKKNLHTVFPFCLLCSLILLVWACDESLETDGLAPVVKVQFFNQDSLQAINGTLNNIGDRLTVIRDSLDTVNQKISDGDITFVPIRDRLQEESQRLSERKNLLNQTANDINSGKVKINRLQAIGALSNPSFDDSLSIYAFPLPMESNRVTFKITLSGKQEDSLTLAYENEVIRDINRIIIQPSKIKAIGHSYDSVKVICTDSTTCISDETTIYIYF